MPRSRPLVEVEADANRSSSCDVAGASFRVMLGLLGLPMLLLPRIHPLNRPCPTVVQAVKAALAAEQASVPCPASMALPNSG